METILLGKEIIVTANKIRRLLDRKISKFGLTGSAARILFFIEKREKHDITTCQKDIEKEFSIRGSSVNGLLATLEKEEYVIKIKNELDGRLKEIVITEKGKNFTDKANKVMMELEVLFENELSNNEKKSIEIGLKRISNMIDEVE